MKPATRKLLMRAVFILIVSLVPFTLAGCGTDSPRIITFVTPSTLPNLTIGVPYSHSIWAHGVTGPPTGIYTYSLIPTNFAEPLPGGLAPAGAMTFKTVNSVGVNDSSVATITGTDITQGDRGKTFTFWVKAVDSETPSHSAMQVYTITVNP